MFATLTMPVLARLLVLLTLCLCLAACAATRRDPERTLPDTGFRTAVSRQLNPEEARRLGEESMLYVYDPAEKVNRLLYNFNARFDRAVLLPAVAAYEGILPAPVRTGVSNFISNLNEMPRLANCGLQGDLNKVNATLVRFLANTTVGLGGLFDVATDMGIDKEDEDFGQTLSVWGVPDGAYIVLPLYGPSNARDTVGTAGDMVFSYYQMQYLYDLAGFSDHALAGYVNTGVRALNTRSGVPFRYYSTDTPFEYDILRFAYTKARILQALD